jgi:hypothetical protein
VSGRRTIFIDGLFKRIKRVFQLWCGDCFHLASVTRSKSVVTDWPAASLGGEVRL